MMKQNKTTYLKSFFLGIMVICYGCIGAKSAHATSYKRIISLSPAITEIIYALGADSQLVGVSNFCDYPPQAQNKEKVGGYLNPSIEKIVSLNPDLVILSPNGGTKKVKETLDGLGVKNMVVWFYTIGELEEAFTVVGRTVGKEEEAHELCEKLQATITHIHNAVLHKQKPRIVFVRSHYPLYVAGKGTYEDDLIRFSGGENAITESGLRYPHYNVEALMELNPDIVVDATFYETPSKKQHEAIREFWEPLKSMNALQEEKLYVIKTDIHSVPGPRTVKMLEILASIIHPDIFENETEYVERVNLTS